MSRSSRWKSLAATLLIAGVAMATPSRASLVTFAQFTQTNAGNSCSFSNLGGSATFGTANLAVNFNFLVGALPGLAAELQGTQAATLTLTSSTTTPVAVAGTFLDQRIDGVLNTISFTRNTPAAAGSGTHKNLLTVMFTADLTGRRGGTTANLNGSTPLGDTVTFTSDFLDFTNTNTRDLALTFTSATPTLAVNGSFLRSFAAAGVGAFASDPSPIVVGSPEPTTLAAGVMGVIFLGALAIRRRDVTTA